MLTATLDKWFTRYHDRRRSAEGKAHAVAFIFYPKSPKFPAPRSARWRWRMSRPTGSWSWSIHITTPPPIYESVIELNRYFKSHPPWSKRDNLEVRTPTPRWDTSSLVLGGTTLGRHAARQRLQRRRRPVVVVLEPGDQSPSRVNRRPCAAPQHPAPVTARPRRAGTSANRQKRRGTCRRRRVCPCGRGPRRG